MRNEFVAVVVAVLVAVTAAAVGFSGSVTADHGTEFGNYTIVLPFDSDHYPRHENPGGPYNGSINHYAAGTQESWDDMGAPDGLERLDTIIVSSQDIDYSECTSDNTAAYGIDRDNDDAGTKTDVSLLNYMEASHFQNNRIVVKHYEGNELAAPDPEDKGGKEAGREDGDGNAELYPSDEVVAHQGYKSAGGPCYGMPEEPGWYQMDGFFNGTNWEGQEVEGEIVSHYFYICKCESRQDAVETLGPPPTQSGQGGGDGEETTETETETETATPTATETETETATETEVTRSDGTDSDGDDSDAGSSQQATATASEAANQADQQAQQSGGNDGGNQQQTDGGQQQAGGQQGQQQQQQQQQQQSTAVPVTPTIAEGPGFGPGAALLALAGAALLALRRRDD